MLAVISTDVVDDCGPNDDVQAEMTYADFRGSSNSEVLTQTTLQISYFVEMPVTLYFDGPL